MLCFVLHLECHSEPFLVFDLLAVNKPKTPICSYNLDEEKANKFKYAVENHYWYEFFMGKWPNDAG